MKIISIRDEKGLVDDGAFGVFYVLSRNKGVKVLGGRYSSYSTFTTIKSLKASETWEDAEKEAKLYNDAYVSGVVPKCYGVRPVWFDVREYTTGYRAGIVLSYIKGKELNSDEIASREYKGMNVSIYLAKKIKDASGIVHGDIYGHNVLVRLNKYGDIIRAWAIDFSPSCCKRVAIKKKGG